MPMQTLKDVRQSLKAKVARRKKRVQNIWAVGKKEEEEEEEEKKLEIYVCLQQNIGLFRYMF